MAEQKTRNVKFDGLRTIGLLAIILAHVNPPAWLFQFRNFDVPLMVLVSGAVYGLSGTNKKYGDYIWGRILRLLVPTWTFLILFFLLNSLLGKQFSTNTILSSFALLNGIGYVWIIRVFILVAIIAPLFVYLYRKITNKVIYLLVVVAVFVFYTLLHHIYVGSVFLQHIPAVDFVFQNIIFYILPFGCVTGLGIYLLHARKKSIILLLGIFAAVFAFLALVYSSHGFMQTQAYKYPPQLYYLSYALAASLMLYLLSFTTTFQKIFSTRAMKFISASSLWIYLWQIFFLFQIKINNFIVAYIIIVLLSVIVTFGQKYFITKVCTVIKNNIVTNFLTITFLK